MVPGSPTKPSNTESVRAKNAPSGGTEKWTEESVPIMGIVGKQCATVLPAPTATATVEADHARL